MPGVWRLRPNKGFQLRSTPLRAQVKPAVHRLSMIYNQKMANILPLLLLFLILSGCSTSSTSSPTNVAPTSETQVQRDLTTPDQVSAPTEVPLEPTAKAQAQPSTILTERPTALPTLMPSPTVSAASSVPSF